MKLSYWLIMCAVCQSGTAASRADEGFRIARWFEDRAAAISLRFDDALESQVETAVPLLNEYGFVGTFMVSPGTRRYQARRDFWERSIPAMGHRLGNHTMHHRGAKSLKQAEDEIGQVCRIIWGLYPDQSQLLVFASGGGEKWGGKYWEQAAPEYKALVEKYHLIDLYDGWHPAIGANSQVTAAALGEAVQRAVQEHAHQAFSFHGIGRPGLLDYGRSLFAGYHFTWPEAEFREFLRGLDQVRDQVWVAPLVDVLKYETEREHAQLEVLSRDAKQTKLQLRIDTDPALYNQPLTVVVMPAEELGQVEEILQEGESVSFVQCASGAFQFNVKPWPSVLTVLCRERFFVETEPAGSSLSME